MRQPSLCIGGKQKAAGPEALYTFACAESYPRQSEGPSQAAPPRSRASKLAEREPDTHVLHNSIMHA